MFLRVARSVVSRWCQHSRYVPGTDALPCRHARIMGRHPIRISPRLLRGLRRGGPRRPGAGQGAGLLVGAAKSTALANPALDAPATPAEELSDPGSTLPRS